MWNLYTPEVGIDSNETAARAMCKLTCEKQPDIKEKVKPIDIAHMSATILGYVHWGISENKSDYSLGDLGGWPLDLLQIWGNYEKNGKGQELDKWLREHLGSKTDGQGFDYYDVLADADAYLIVTRSVINLSDTLSSLYKYSKNERIKMFFKERFNSSKQNVIDSFVKLSDGIDVLMFENLEYGKGKLLHASKAERLPTREEAIILAKCFADFIANPM